MKYLFYFVEMSDNYKYDHWETCLTVSKILGEFCSNFNAETIRCFFLLNLQAGRSRWPRRLHHESATAFLLALWVQISPEA